MLLQHTGILCYRDAGGEGSPGIILELPVLLRRSEIFCHRGAVGKGSLRIVPGLPVLLGILSHRGVVGGDSLVIIPVLPVFLWCSGDSATGVLGRWYSCTLGYS